MGECLIGFSLPKSGEMEAGALKRDENSALDELVISFKCCGIS